MFFMYNSNHRPVLGGLIIPADCTKLILESSIFYLAVLAFSLMGVRSLYLCTVELGRVGEH